MVNTNNEHVSPKKGGWIVRREGSSKSSKLFGKKNEATEYASIIASMDGGSVVSHKYNGQFKKFINGNEIEEVRNHKIASLITGTIEIEHPITNSVSPVIEMRT